MYKTRSKPLEAFNLNASMDNIKFFNSALATKDNPIYLDWLKRYYKSICDKCGGKPFIPSEEIKIEFEEKARRYCDAHIIWNTKKEGRVKWLRAEIKRVCKLLGKRAPKL